jgi:hypothetical protein
MGFVDEQVRETVEKLLLQTGVAAIKCRGRGNYDIAAGEESINVRQIG